MDSIRILDPSHISNTAFKARLADCVILTHDNKILMQQRPAHWKTYPGALNLFGGHIEDNETPVEGLIRELNEELGAVVKPEDLTKIGALTEECTKHSEIIHTYFWHDIEHTITGCYEAESREFNSVEDTVNYQGIMDYAVWCLKECQKQGLLK